MSIASVISVIATARYEFAIILPKKDKDAINIVFLSLLISIFISLITFIIILFFDDKIVESLGEQKILYWLYFIPITVLLTGFYQSFSYWHNRKKQYKNISLNLINRSGTTASVNLIMGFGKIGNGGLIVGSILGQFFATIMLGILTFKDTRKFFLNINKLKMIALAKIYKKLPIYNLPNALLDNLKMLIIYVLISKLFTNQALGQFSLSWKILQTPMALIGTSLAQVLYQKIATLDTKELNRIIKIFLFKATCIGFPIFTIIYFFSENIFSFVFGEEWKLAGSISSILAPWLFINFLTSPLATIFILLKRQGTLLIFSLVYMITPIFIFLFFKEKDFLTILNYVSFSMSILLIIFIYLIFNIISTKNIKEKYVDN
jgi:O-antigen/teichoic acid export membrane protein